jgi:hypothetical protein
MLGSIEQVLCLPALFNYNTGFSSKHIADEPIAWQIRCEPSAVVRIGLVERK